MRMYIRCWGSRGSIPVSGSCYNRYGGDTTCMEIRSSKGDLIVIDTGSGCRSLGDKLAAEKIRKFDILYTHAHIDHLMGFPFFVPIYNKENTITIHGCPFTMSSYKNILKGIMTAPYCPVEFKSIPAKLDFKIIESRPFRIGSLKITPIKLSHPNGGLGFSFEENGKKFVFLTDNELEYRHPNGFDHEDYAAFCRDADLLIHDAEYTPQDYNRAWGHSIFTHSVKLAIVAGVKRLGMFHINQRRTDRQVDSMVKLARNLIATLKADVDCFAVGNQYKITL